MARKPQSPDLNCSKGWGGSPSPSWDRAGTRGCCGSSTGMTCVYVRARGAPRSAIASHPPAPDYLGISHA